MIQNLSVKSNPQHINMPLAVSQILCYRYLHQTRNTEVNQEQMAEASQSHCMLLEKNCSQEVLQCNRFKDFIPIFRGLGGRGVHQIGLKNNTFLQSGKKFPFQNSQMKTIARMIIHYQ